MPNIVPQLVAGGDIPPCRFVMITGPFSVQTAQEGCSLIGISSEAVVTTPLEDWQDTPLAARQGDPVHLYSEGDICLLECGTTILPGNLLKSDSTGRALPVTGDYDLTEHYGAVALEAGTAGEKIHVQVRFGMTRNPRAPSSSSSSSGL